MPGRSSQKAVSSAVRWKFSPPSQFTSRLLGTWSGLQCSSKPCVTLNVFPSPSSQKKLPPPVHRPCSSFGGGHGWHSLHSLLHSPLATPPIDRPISAGTTSSILRNVSVRFISHL